MEPTAPQEDGFTSDDRAKVKRGVVVTLVGRLAETCRGIYLFAARYLYGGPDFGLFIIAYALMELLSRFLVGGFGDAVTYFAAQHAQVPPDESEADRAVREEHLYRAIGTCLLVPLVLSVVAAAGMSLSAELLYDWIWREQDRELVACVQLLAWVLPLAVLMRLPVEAVKAHLDLKWAVIVADGLLPILNLGLAVLFVLFDPGPIGLVWATLLSHALVLPLAWYGFTRYFDLRRTVAALRHGALDRGVLAFGLPQSVNMMFNYGLVRVDSLMLSAFITADRVGVYTLVSELARTIRMAKTSFSSVFAPLVAKYRAQRNHRGLVESLHLISRWTSALSVPLLFVIMALYADIILGPSTRWTESLWFPWMLTLGPMLSCFFGLAGNLLLMTGHSRMLLMNSTVMMGLNVGLNFLLIPPFGMMGAATATMISQTVITVAQLVEMKRYEGVAFTAQAYLKPLAAGALTIVPIALLNMPFAHAVVFQWGAAVGFTLKIVVVLVCVALYAATIFFWPGENPEREWLERWRAGRRERSRRRLGSRS